MNYSLEEIFANNGQYDKFVSIEFNYNSEEYNKFGFRIMGTFFFTLKERTILEKVINSENIPRTDKKIKFIPSELEKLTTEQKVDLDKDGILCSSISLIYVTDYPKTNRFKLRGKKDFQNVLNIKAPEFSGWEELNRVRFGFLNSRISQNQNLSPLEYIQYWAFRIHLEIRLKEKDFTEIITNGNKEFKAKVRLEELRLKYQELSITEEEIKDFVKLIIKEIAYKNEIINQEITKSTEQIKNISEEYGEELENLKKICRGFDEKVIAFGTKLIYLDFERFVHIYARHVAETQIGDRFVGNKSVFQYKFDDIISLIKMVIESINVEINEHFENHPDQQFRRMNSRSVYFDGHYYRIVIEPNGRLLDFHPYNDDTNTGANKVYKSWAISD